MKYDIKTMEIFYGMLQLTEKLSIFLVLSLTIVLERYVNIVSVQPDVEGSQFVSDFVEVASVPTNTNTHFEVDYKMNS